jgi:diguanylate cyclase
VVLRPQSSICGLSGSIWAFLVCCLLVAPAAAVAGAAPLEVHGFENGVAIAPHSELLEDRSGQLELSSVRARSSGWQPGPQDALVFGFSNSTWWARWSLHNATPQPRALIVTLGNSRPDYVTWFVLRDAARRIERSVGGDRHPFAERSVAIPELVLPLNLAPHEHVEVYVRLQSFDGMFEPMPLAIYQRAAFFETEARKNLLFGLYHGALLALALYNLLLFLATRERVFGVYVMYLLSFLLWSFTFRGDAFQFLWPNAPAFNNDILTVGAALSFAMAGLFGIVYLRMYETVPRWVLNLNLTLVVANLLVLIPAFSGRYALGAELGHFAGLPMAISLQATGIWLLRRGSRQARFFVVAFAVVGIGATAYILQIVNLLPTNWFTSWGVQLGSAIEMMLLALGLADSMNTLKAEKLRAERTAREAQQALNVRLEQQVEERTQALEQANHRLHELAITDELTGAFNRRHFNALCQVALSQQSRRDPLAFCMFDLDHFKSYNDRYGHQAGDAALKRVAQVVQAELHRSHDVLFRLGGEEFGVLFTAASPESATQFVELLRKAVVRAAIPHSGNPTGSMTASFGVGWWGPGVVYRMTPEQMYAAADTMLYEAKESGRNCVAVSASYATGRHPLSSLKTV